ncbi:leucine aminopeptidase 2, chloroplastic-like [Silene latifolia]|uniref:leucine aminopeptidase 2, chloroplastic-like n=1 Tax=Silene latifolia TaxID=37657 RepID=UPI003D77C758
MYNSYSCTCLSYCHFFVQVTCVDAEGRLTIVDALVYACNQGVDKIIDLATLTGPCVVAALGPSIAGIFTLYDSFAKEVMVVVEANDEKFWRLPLEDSHWQLMESGVADMVSNNGLQGDAVRG